jgi:choline dehydrogenase
LLELSGIGQREVLAAAGVPLVHEVRMVGENLSEHVYSPTTFRAKPGVSWNSSINSPLGQAKIGARWLFTRKGPMVSNTITAQAFAPSVPGGKDAELKIQIQQVSSPGNRGKGKGQVRVDDFDGFTIASFQIRPRSRGTAHITSANPAADPRLVSNHFSHPDDMQACLLAIQLSRKIAATGPLAQLVISEERPGAKGASDEALMDHIRSTGATAYHPVGTCRMGTDPAQSVVDTQLRVHGIQGLRVADGSVMPSIASTNTNAICIVIGERAADFILNS